MTSKDNAALVALRNRYDELHVELNAIHDAKPIDWDAAADIEEKLAELMNDLSKAVWSRDSFFGRVAIDAMGGFRRSAVDTRRLSRQINRGAQ